MHQESILCSDLYQSLVYNHRHRVTQPDAFTVYSFHVLFLRLQPIDIKVFVQNFEFQKFCDSDVRTGTLKPTATAKGGWSQYTVPFASFKCTSAGATAKDVGYTPHNAFVPCSMHGMRRLHDRIVSTVTRSESCFLRKHGTAVFGPCFDPDTMLLIYTCVQMLPGEPH